MINQYYQDYQSQGITVIPIEWDTIKMQPVRMKYNLDGVLSTFEIEDECRYY